jgi:hypothetical protein
MLSLSTTRPSFLCSRVATARTTLRTIGRRRRAARSSSASFVSFRRACFGSAAAAELADPSTAHALAPHAAARQRVQLERRSPRAAPPPPS